MKKVLTYLGIILILTSAIYSCYPKSKIWDNSGSFTAFCSNKPHIIIACSPPGVSGDSLYACRSKYRSSWGQSFQEAVEKICGCSH
jgi:hypothetical protein